MAKNPILYLAGALAVAGAIYALSPKNIYKSEEKQVRYVDLNQDGITDKITFTKETKYSLDEVLFGVFLTGRTDMDYVRREAGKEEMENIRKMVAEDSDQ